MPSFARVALNIPVEKTFIYEIPQNLQHTIKRFQLVKIPFGNRSLSGLILEIGAHFPELDSLETNKIKSISMIIDEIPRITEELYKLALWISGYFLSSIGEALFCLFPSSAPAKKNQNNINKNSDAPLIPIHRLTALQEKTYKEICRSFFRLPKKPVLLYGITGSGKTEIYLKLIQDTLDLGKSVLFLVPEIGLSHQTVIHIKNHFQKVAILNSRMSPLQKVNEWKSIANGDQKIVVGPRSAVFAPVKDLGLIIIDEEHSPFYKEHSSPRYHARQVAYMRAKESGASLLLGSATPSVESVHLANKDFYALVSLTERYNHASLPLITTIKHNSFKDVFHPTMIEKIKDRLAKKEQIILFLNKRGFSDVLVCSDCSHIFTCESCDISYTYHRIPEKKLQCHYCGQIRPIPEKCPVCQSVRLHPSGTGTQKIELLLKKLFPDALIARFDFDTTRKKDDVSSMYQDFLAQKIDILVGTQMIGHGFHFPGVTFVGIIGFEMMLNWPDFRSVENTLSLLFQISGRAGRGSIPGEVCIQATNEDISFFNFLKSNDYMGYAEKELSLRKETFYPPFSRLVRFLFKDRNEKKAKQSSIDVASFIRNTTAKILLLGPAPAPLPKIGNLYRYHLIIKYPHRTIEINSLIKNIKSYIMDNNIACEIDIDPISMV